MNGISQNVEILRTEAGPGTGDMRQIARDGNGNLMAFQSYFGINSLPTDTPTGDQWGTLS